MEKMLSVILPVYNVEKHVERCIRSLQDQDIPHYNYEVIVVNDGSPDNSREVVVRLMKEFNNIVFVEQENRGVSMARNAGIERATGKYVLFIDPDDYAEPNTLGRIILKCERQSAQVSFLGYQLLNEAGTTKLEVFNVNESGNVYNGMEAYVVSRGDGKADPDRSWAILFERCFLSKNKLKYLANVPYLEDGEFIARVLCLARVCIFDGRSFYRRTKRMGSATHSNLFNEQRTINGFIKAAVNLKEFQEKVSLSEHQTFLNQPIVKFTLLAIQGCASIRSIKYFKKTREVLRQTGLSKLNLDGCNSLYYRFGRLYNFSALLFLLYFFLNKIRTSISLKLQ